MSYITGSFNNYSTVTDHIVSNKESDKDEGASSSIEFQFL
jgi:hypothetical protein